MDDQVRLEPVGETDREVLRQLLELYLYDFSEFTGEDVNQHGRYGYEYLDHYWTESTRYPFLLRVNDQIAGFILVRDQILEDGLVVHSMAEFFVMRKYRRKNIGRQAAFQAFDRFPGRWRVTEIEENLPAQNFWRQIIAEYTGGQFSEGVNPSGDGPMQEFSAPAGK